MRRNMSSRLLFSDDDDNHGLSSSFLDIENPPERPHTRRQQRRRVPFSLQLRTQQLLSALLSRAPQCSICTHYLAIFLLFLCISCLIYSVSSTLPIALIAVSVLVAIYVFFKFKTTSRTHLFTFGSTSRRQRSIFLDINEQLAVRKSIISNLGVELLYDGTQYAGEFENGVPTGRGRMDRPGKFSYGGDWVKGRPQGYGVENIWTCGGTVYKGQFLKGARAGYGRMQHSNGEKYIGQWSNGSRHGIGRQQYVDGSFYEGHFCQDMKHGSGAYHQRYGDFYQGEYFQDKITGVGIYHFSSGERYEGSWHDNEMEGYGIYIQKDNQVPISGKWVKGSINKEDYIPVSEPCIKMTVQAAQEAARNCKQLGEIENQVFKAVCEANNAYKAAQLASTNAHYISKLHPLHPRRLAVMASTESLKALRTLRNFGRTTAKNVARLMAGWLS